MMMDAHGDIHFHKIFEWMLPTFEGVSFYEFLSARMLNYMLYSIKDNGWTPLYYPPADGKVISADNVARFFGCQLSRSLRGNPSIQRTWSTRESLDAIGTCMECSGHVYISMTIGTTNGMMCTRGRRGETPPEVLHVRGRLQLSVEGVHNFQTLANL
jgi:hypothetical protein